ncbi:MAG: orotidine 5'-phosphate decarboxylase / HUMPS family protein [Candidatus Geothermarchaeales archaeon]
MGGTFVEKIQLRKMTVNSPIVLALDLYLPLKEWIDEPGKQQTLLNECKDLIEGLSDGLVGVKMGFPLLLSLGSTKLHHLIGEMKGKSENLVFIGDFKISDIANTNLLIVRHLFDLGFDAVIFHVFTGYEGGFDKIIEEARDRGMGTIGIVYMSHPGALSFFEETYGELVSLGVKHGVDGFIVPGTRPQIIRRIRSEVKEKTLLFAPGIGVQGGDPGETLKAGANFLIVGRSIYGSQDPSEALNKLLSSIRSGV